MKTLCLVLCLNFSGSPVLEESPEKTTKVLVDEQAKAESAHLLRLGVWAGASVVVGSGLLVIGQFNDVPELRGFGAQAIMWGAIDLAIVTAGALSKKESPTSLSKAIQNENTWYTLLLVNVGLDAGYMMTGGTMATLGALGAPYGRDLIGHGSGVVVQGGALLALDLWAAFESFPRQQALYQKVDSLTNNVE